MTSIVPAPCSDKSFTENPPTSTRGHGRACSALPQLVRAHAQAIKRMALILSPKPLANKKKCVTDGARFDSISLPTEIDSRIDLRAIPIQSPIPLDLSISLFGSSKAAHEKAAVKGNDFSFRWSCCSGRVTAWHSEKQKVQSTRHKPSKGSSNIQ